MLLRRKRLAILCLLFVVTFLAWRWKVSTTIEQHVHGYVPGTPPHHEAVPVRPEQLPVHDTPFAKSQRNSLANLYQLPTRSSTRLSKVQASFSREPKDFNQIHSARQRAVREAFLHSWNGYRKHAWLKDEVGPLDGGYRSTFGGWAATLVDSLDTLWIMGLKNEFDEAVNALSSIDFKQPDSLPINVFETTIRHLGGLLGAYDVSQGQYPVLLKKAKEVGEMLYAAFDTPNRMPVTRWSKSSVETADGNAIMAEVGSLSLEFTRLSQLTGDMKFFDAVQRVTDCFDSQQMQTKVPGLFPHIINARQCDFTQDVTFSLAGHADSTYEYLPKMHQLLGGALSQYEIMYRRTLQPIKDRILFKPMTLTNADILFPGILKVYPRSQEYLEPDMQHLACFAGGMFALSSKLFSLPEDLLIARKLVDGCIWAYNATPAKIMPDVFRAIPCPAGTSIQPSTVSESCPWSPAMWLESMLLLNSNDVQPGDKSLTDSELVDIKSKRLRLPPGMSAIQDRNYHLRPEAIESVFILYRITADPALLERGWEMFLAVEKATRTDIAHAELADVTQAVDPIIDQKDGQLVNPDIGGTTGRRITHHDRMQSFWLAETLKYFYLLFGDPDKDISLDDFVFNTEAHPFRLRDSRAG